MSPGAEKGLIAAGLFVITTVVFFGTEALLPSHPRVSWIITRWDAALPLVPAAVWPYVSWYVAPAMALAAPRREFRRIAWAILVSFAICEIVFVAMPASVERPEVAGFTLSERALRMVYRVDPPWNVFPSFHAALCAILAMAARGSALQRGVVWAWMAVICAACVLTKQHGILDIVAGLGVGVLTWPIVRGPSSAPPL
jgi:membrane-associated phospholipid phosphatase